MQTPLALLKESKCLRIYQCLILLAWMAMQSNALGDFSIEELSRAGGNLPVSCQFRSLTSFESSHGASQMDEFWVLQPSGFAVRFRLRLKENSSFIVERDAWQPEDPYQETGFKNLMLRNEDYQARCVLGLERKLNSVDPVEQANGLTTHGPFYGSVHDFVDFKSAMASPLIQDVTSQPSSHGMHAVAAELPIISDRGISEAWKFCWTFDCDKNCIAIDANCAGRKDQSYQTSNTFLKVGSAFVPSISLQRYQSGALREIRIAQYHTPTAVKPELFRLKHYGFPEPIQPQSTHFPWGTALLAGAGILLLMAAYWIRK